MNNQYLEDVRSRTPAIAFRGLIPIGLTSQSAHLEGIDMQELTQDLVKSIFDYDPETGIFINKTNRSNIYKGSIAGVKFNSGYIILCINGKRYPAHRVAWLYMYGEYPKNQIDHINRIRDDNRISNLRQANKYENGHNGGLRRDNTSGFRGVSYHSRDHKYQASAQINGKQYCLGYYLTAKEAAVAYDEFTKVHHKEFYNGINKELLENFDE